MTMSRLMDCNGETVYTVALLSLFSNAKKLLSTVEEAWGMCRKQHACWLTPTVHVQRLLIHVWPAEIHVYMYEWVAPVQCYSAWCTCSLLVCITCTCMYSTCIVYNVHVYIHGNTCA